MAAVVDANAGELEAAGISAHSRFFLEYLGVEAASRQHECGRESRRAGPQDADRTPAQGRFHTRAFTMARASCMGWKVTLGQRNISFVQ